MPVNNDLDKTKLLNLLGLSQKAGYIVSGEDNVIVEMRKGRVKIVFVAKDSSEKTRDNFEKKCYFYKVKVCFDYTGAELSSAIGKERRILALTNDKMYTAMKKYLEVNE